MVPSSVCVCRDLSLSVSTYDIQPLACRRQVAGMQGKGRHTCKVEDIIHDDLEWSPLFFLANYPIGSILRLDKANMRRERNFCRGGGGLGQTSKHTRAHTQSFLKKIMSEA